MTEEQSAGSLSAEDRLSGLFANLVLQQTNMILMLLGKVAHPESGQTFKDIEGARVMIDQLEMLETKTKGNLTREESGLLKQSLMSLRLAFVEEVQSPGAGKTEKPAEAIPAAEAAPGEKAPAGDAASAEEEHRKKFSKKY